MALRAYASRAPTAPPAVRGSAALRSGGHLWARENRTRDSASVGAGLFMRHSRADRAPFGGAFLRRLLRRGRAWAEREAQRSDGFASAHLCRCCPRRLTLWKLSGARTCIPPAPAGRFPWSEWPMSKARQDIRRLFMRNAEGSANANRKGAMPLVCICGRPCASGRHCAPFPRLIGWGGVVVLRRLLTSTD